MYNSNNILPQEQTSVVPEFPLSTAQWGVWFAQEINHNASAKVYKITEYLEISGQIDPVCFEAAIRRTVDETESCHLVFQRTADGLRQKLIDLPAWEFPVLDMSTREDPEASAQRWMINDMERPFDLQQGPLFSFALLRLEPERFFFHVSGHHIMMDGFGGVLFSSRLAEIYSALVAGETTSETPFVGVADIVQAEADYENSKQFQRDRRYWNELMDNRPEPVSLAEQEIACADILRRQTYLPDSTNQALRAFAVRCGTTLPQLLTTLIAVYFYRVTGQEDLLLGFPVMARNSRVLRAFPGMMTNVLPLRLLLNPQIKLQECLEQVKKQVTAIVRHQRYRGETLRSDLNMSVDSGMLFSTTINIMPFEYDIRFAGHPVAVHNLCLGPTDDLSVNIYDRGAENGLELCIDANTALYDEACIEAHFQRLVHFFAMAAKQNPELPVTRYELLLPQERRQILEQWNQTEAAYPAQKCIHELVEQQAQLHPDALAVVCCHHRMTYGELNTQANQLARYLRQSGVGPEKRVAICFDRGSAFIIAMFAVLKAGAGYVPIDPAYPPERIQYMLEDSTPEVLLTDGILSADILTGLQSATRLIHFHTDAYQWVDNAKDNLPRDALTPRNLAYIIYTSGSTGKPKGVMVEHASLTNLIQWHISEFGLESGHCASSVAGMGFDAAVWEIWPPLCAGAYLALPPLSVSRDPEQLLNWWVTQPIHTGFLSTPIAELAFARHIKHPTLRTLLVGGDRLNHLPAADASFTLVNNYGPTETTVVATSGPVSITDPLLHIGRPLNNMKIYILDNQRQLVPVGVEGEIYIGGVGVTRGYLNRPELTAERFLTDPFSDVPGARMYRSGDLARWLPDGNIQYSGRNDSQVKIRGFRIEPGEVAAVLQRCEQIRNAVVIATDSPSGEKRLVAYYTLQNTNTEVSAAMLKQHLGKELPDYMVPAAYVCLEQIPLTANGKVNYRILPQPDETAFVRQSYQAPQSPVEQMLAEVWQSLLGVEKVGRQDHFFELGGHSLLAVQMIEQLRKRGYQLAVKLLFEQPVLSELACLLTPGEAEIDGKIPPSRIPRNCQQITPEMLPLVDLTQNQIDTLTAEIPGGAANVQDIYPLGPLQQGLLVQHLLQKQGDLYIIRMIQSFPDQKALQAFIDALQSVICRHDILRTSVAWEGLEQPVQIVWREAPLDVVTLTLDAPDIAAALEQRFRPELSRIPLHRAPMIQVYQVEDPRNHRWLLCLRMHHLCTDHTSLELMIEEIQAHWQGKAEQLPEPLPFRNYIARLAQQDLQAPRTYFTRLLKDYTMPVVPFGLSHIQGEAGEARSIHLSVGDGLAQRLRHQAKIHQVSTASLFHLIWGLVLREATGCHDVVTGTILFGRMSAGPGADRTLGLFLNTLPFRMIFDQTTTADMIQSIHHQLAELMAYEHAPLALAQQCSGVPASQPLFSSLLNYRYQGGNAQVDALEHLPMDIIMEEERSTYPLSLSVNDCPGQGFSLDIQADIRVSCELVGTAVTDTLSCLVTVLEQTPSRPVNCFHAISESESAPMTLNKSALPVPDAHADIRRDHSEPQGQNEQILARLWATVLAVEPIGREDDFFALGGSSLSGIRLIHLARKYGLYFSLQTLFSASTLKDLAIRILADAPEPAGIIAFRAEGRQTPLFIVPEATGELMYGPMLADAIDSDIPVYGLVSPQHNLSSLKTIQGLANYYTKAILRIQSQGPFRLLGWSLGGNIAYEIAAQLMGRDQPVEFIGLLDSPALNSGFQRYSHDQQLAEEERLTQVSQDVFDALVRIHTPSEVVCELARTPEHKHWQDHYRLAQESGILPEHWSEAYYKDWLFCCESLCSSGYQTPSLPVDIDIFVAQERLEGDEIFEQPFLGWDRILDKEAIHLTTIPGDHYHLLSASFIRVTGLDISAAIAAGHTRLQNQHPVVPEETPLVTLKNGEASGPLLFCIPGAGNNVFSFMELVQYIRPEWTVWGGQPRGLWGNAVPHTSVQAAAQYYLRGLKQQFPDGPIHLLGHSYGGWVALELAILLAQQGTPVASLTILDTEVPVDGYREYSDMQALLHLLEVFEMRGAVLGLTSRDLAGLSTAQQLQMIHRKLVRQKQMPETSTPADLAAIFRVYACGLRSGYAPQFLPVVPTHLILSEQSNPVCRDEWHALMPEITCSYCRGNHMTMLKSPYAGELAAQYQQFVDVCPEKNMS